MDLPVTISPPTIKPSEPLPASGSAQEISDQTPPETSPAPTESIPTQETKQSSAKTSDKGADFVKSVGEKIEALLKGETVLDKSPAKGTPKKTQSDKPAESDSQKPETAKESSIIDKDDSDEAIKKEIETKTRGMDGAARKAWADLRYAERDLRRRMKDMVPSAKLTELQKSLAETQAALEAAKANSADPVELNKLREELAAAKKRDEERELELMATRVERSETFQKEVTRPREKIYQMAKSLAKKYELSERELIDALNDTSEAQTDRLTELTERMNRFEIAKIDAAVSDLIAINEKEAELRQKSKELLSSLEAAKTNQTAEEIAKIKAAREAAHAKNWQALKEALPEILTPVEGDDETVKNWNKAQQDAETFAKTADFNTYAPEIQSQLLQRAAVFPLMAGMLQSFKSQLESERAAHEATKIELSKFLEKRPGGASDHDDNVTTGDEGEVDFVKRVETAIRKAGL